jgi:hypothetical protein
MSSLLILTVGTGTSGAHSDVSAGLARTVDLTDPRLYWLVPSQSEKSIPVADLIRERVTSGGRFVPWSAEADYHAIPDPDDIHSCRRVLREVIRVARAQLQPSEQLVINPTGGTKQMSAGATLAALDEEAGELMFTTGERVDGVVKTGTELPRSFATEAFFLQRDLRIAESLFECGSFYAAARVLRPYGQAEAQHARSIALCLHEWQRMNYGKAAEYAAAFSPDTAKNLENLQKSDPFGTSRLGDLLAGADELLSWGDCEEALARYYRAAEQAAKVRLADTYGLRPPYWLDKIREISPTVAEELRFQAKDGMVRLGAQRAWEVLQKLADPMADAYFQDPSLTEGLRRRNDSMYGHGDIPVSQAEVQSVADRLRNLLKEHLPAAKAAWTTRGRPTSLVHP